MCRDVVLPADNRRLVLINIRANSLEGPAQVLERCDALVQLDISQNRWSGQCPGRNTCGLAVLWMATALVHVEVLI